MRPGYAGWHVMWHTYCAWLPGDPRGFRDNGHRIHSSGDYKNPPPRGEHEGLHRHAKRISRPEVVLQTSDLRRTILNALLDLCREADCLPVAIAVCRVHIHLLAEMPIDKQQLDRVITRLKTKSSAAVRGVLPGRIWARGDKRILKRDRAAQLQCVRYIDRHDNGASDVWRFRTPALVASGTSS